MSLGCCPWKCCRSSASVAEEAENGTRVIRKTTKNGQTVTTTTTTYFNNHPTSARGQIHMETSSFSRSDPDEPLPLNKPIVPKPKASSFREECLSEHNRLRALHGCPPLKLSSKLSAIAQKWAVHMAKSNSMEHSKSKYGENLFMCTGSFVNGSKPVQSWYNEIQYYSFRNPVFSFKTGHFSQVVWKDSKELGVGVEIRGNTTWIVANYDPPGNVQGSFEPNVPRLLRQ